MKDMFQAIFAIIGVAFTVVAIQFPAGSVEFIMFLVGALMGFYFVYVLRKK